MTGSNLIREANDKFRSSCLGGELFVSLAVSELPNVWDIVQSVRKYDRFRNLGDDDHTFGFFDVGGNYLYWRIETCPWEPGVSPFGKGNGALVAKALTICLASER